MDGMNYMAFAACFTGLTALPLPTEAAKRLPAVQPFEVPNAAE